MLLEFVDQMIDVGGVVDKGRDHERRTTRRGYGIMKIEFRRHVGATVCVMAQLVNPTPA